MTGGTRARAAALALGSSLLGGPGYAQTSGTIEVGVSTVHYDGFLPSAAFSVAPGVDWERPSGGVSARGTYLRFETGHESVQGAVTARLATAPVVTGRRAELAVSTGASHYLDFTAFWHAVARARLELLDLEHGAWIGVTAGTTSHGGVPRPVSALTAGAWWRSPGLTLRLSGNGSRIGDTTYTDLESSVHADQRSVALDVAVGARLSNGASGSEAYGEASAAISLGERTALVVGGGRYPTDPVSGSLAATYLTVALGFRLGTPRRVVHRAPAPQSPSVEPSSLPGVRLEVHAEPSGSVRLVVDAPEATRVELAGDFTDWEPVPLVRVGRTWEASLQIAPGVHRANVRIDGGVWIVPVGVTRSIDDYGSEVGIFAVP